MNGGFWWRANLKILREYKNISTIQVNNGLTCMRWEDSWLDEAAKLKFPKLYSFDKNRQISISKAVSHEQPI